MAARTSEVAEGTLVSTGFRRLLSDALPEADSCPPAEWRRPGHRTGRCPGGVRPGLRPVAIGEQGQQPGGVRVHLGLSPVEPQPEPFGAAELPPRIQRPWGAAVDPDIVVSRPGGRRRPDCYRGRDRSERHATSPENLRRDVPGPRSHRARSSPGPSHRRRHGPKAPGRGPSGPAGGLRSHVLMAPGAPRGEPGRRVFGWCLGGSSVGVSAGSWVGVSAGSSVGGSVPGLSRRVVPRWVRLSELSAERARRALFDHLLGLAVARRDPRGAGRGARRAGTRRDPGPRCLPTSKTVSKNGPQRFC